MKRKGIYYFIGIVHAHRLSFPVYSAIINLNVAVNGIQNINKRRMKIGYFRFNERTGTVA